MKSLKNINGGVFVVTKSLLEPYYEIETKEIEKIRPLKVYEGGIVVYDDVLGRSKNLLITRLHPFLQEGDIKPEMFIVYHSPFLIFEKNNRKRNNSNIRILFEQTLKDVEVFHGDLVGIDVFLDDFKHLCRRAWEKVLNHVYIDRFKKRKKTCHPKQKQKQKQLH